MSFVDTIFPSDNVVGLKEETVFPVDWKDILLCITHSSFEYLKHWASSQEPRPKISLLKEFCSQI